jgi:hypothetical protein
MEANLYGFGILTLFMLGVFALLLIIIWVFSREGDKQRSYDSERMKVFEVSQEKNFGVIANALKETVSPLAQRVEETFEITEVGFKNTTEALNDIKEGQAKEERLNEKTQNILEGVAKEISQLQAKAAELETVSTQQFNDLKASVATLQRDLSDMVQLVKEQLEKAKSE